MLTKVFLQFGEKGKIVWFTWSQTLLVQKVNNAFVSLLNQITDNLIIKVLYWFPL